MRNGIGVGEGFMKFGSICLLSVLWLVCCLPIITAGASTCAMYAMTIKMVEDEEDSTIKGFFKAFKSNFKKSTIAWILVLLAAVMIYFHYFFVRDFAEGIFQFYYAFIGIEVVLLSLVLVYLFPLIGRYENTVLNSIKNALLMAVSHLGTCVVVILLWGVPVIGCLLNPEIFFTIWYLWIVPGGAFIAYLTSIPIRKSFDKTEKAQEIAKVKKEIMGDKKKKHRN